MHCILHYKTAVMMRVTHGHHSIQKYCNIGFPHVVTRQITMFSLVYGVLSIMLVTSTLELG